MYSGTRTVDNPVMWCEDETMGWTCSIMIEGNSHDGGTRKALATSSLSPLESAIAASGH